MSLPRFVLHLSLSVFHVFHLSILLYFRLTGHGNYFLLSSFWIMTKFTLYLGYLRLEGVFSLLFPCFVRLNTFYMLHKFSLSYPLQLISINDKINRIVFTFQCSFFSFKHLIISTQHIPRVVYQNFFFFLGNSLVILPGDWKVTSHFMYDGLSGLTTIFKRLESLSVIK